MPTITGDVTVLHKGDFVLNDDRTLGSFTVYVVASDIFFKDTTYYQTLHPYGRDRLLMNYRLGRLKHCVPMSEDEKFRHIMEN